MFLWATRCHGRRSCREHLFILLSVSAIFILLFLGAHKLWTLENRWADISLHMLYTGDFWHPMREGHAYFDKPVLSYWPIVWVSYIFHGLNTFTLRLPSALAGIASIYLTYRLGSKIKNPDLGLLAGWMLLSTVLFVFWSRTASANMLNLFGILAAVTWYFEHQDDQRFKSYLVFFVICALTSLCKGLTGIVLPLMIIFPHAIKNFRFIKHLNWKALLALLIGTGIYFFPFYMAGHFAIPGFDESGLHLVYRENILRYFQPFDNFGAWYLYFKYLPIYLSPWIIFFIPAVIFTVLKYNKTDENQRWLFWAFLIVFAFFNLTGSKRDYYILPLLPYCVLLSALWFQPLNCRWVFKTICAITLSLIFIIYAFIFPWYYSGGGMPKFAKEIRARAEKIAPWSKWHVSILHNRGSIVFYLQPHQLPTYYSIVHIEKIVNSTQWFQHRWPFLMEKKPPLEIYITRQRYIDSMKPFFKGYQMIKMPLNNGDRAFHKHNEDDPVAFLIQR